MSTLLCDIILLPLVAAAAANESGSERAVASFKDPVLEVPPDEVSAKLDRILVDDNRPRNILSSTKFPSIRNGLRRDLGKY